MDRVFFFAGIILLFADQSFGAERANGLASVDLPCGSDLMIHPVSVTCSAADGSLASLNLDAVRLAAVTDMCIGTDRCTVNVASLGGTTCSNPKPHTFITYGCLSALDKDGASTVQLICSKRLVIEPLEVRCSSPGRTSWTQAEAAKLSRLTTELGRVNRYTVNAASLGDPACVAPKPNTWIFYKCRPAPPGLKCYHCNSNDALSSCGTVVEPEDVKAAIGFGCTACQKTVVNAHVTRRCMLAQCSTTSNYANVHCCGTNLCNNSSAASRRDYNLLVMLLAVICTGMLQLNSPNIHFATAMN